MNQNNPSNWMIEPERYELYSAPMYTFDLNRRQFLRTMGGGVLVLSLLSQNVTAQETRRESRGRQSGQDLPDEIGAWLHIGEDGEITIFTGKVEVGQNIRTSLAQVVAEELHTPLNTIKMVMGDTDLTPYDAGTFGSRTTPAMSPQLRRVAAAAREILIDLAVKESEVDRSLFVVSEGKVSNREGDQSYSFGELTKGQEIVQTLEDNISLTPVDEWKVAGTSTPKVDGRLFVTGEHRYTCDMTLPGMLYGKILRPSSFNATLTSLDTKEAEAIPGVSVVRDGNFIGVTAPDPITARRAIEAIQAEWKSESQPSDEEIFDYLKGHPVEGRGGGWGGSSQESGGSLQEGFAKSKQTLEETYHIHYIAHVPLETRAALADWKDGKLTVWTGTQRPFGVQNELAQALQIPRENVRVIMPDTGSGYGGKHTGEAAVEAARLAVAVKKPIKLVWSREEEFTWAYFRPAGVIDIKSGLDEEGRITVWDFHNYNSGGSGIRALYDIPHQNSQFHRTESPLRQGSYRALAATANHFARESHIDSLAHEMKIDPLEFRLKNIKDERLRNVLTAAAEAFGWSEKKSTEDRGFGLACGFEKNGYVATCAEVEIDRQKKQVRVLRVVESFDCGPIINPEHIKNQIEGMILMGIGGALFEAIRFENGKIRNPNFSEYRVPRFGDTPKMEIVLIDRKDIAPAGAGETPIVTVAPAIGNAIYNSTGTRLRTLPMTPNGLKV